MRTAHAASQNADRARLAGTPANQTETAEQPIPYSFSMTSSQKTRCAAQAAALDPERLDKLPSYLSARLEWMSAILAMAWRDRAGFAQVPDEDQPITPAEIEEFGRNVEFARECEAGRTMPVNVVVTDVAKMSDGAIWTEMLAHRGKLCDALGLRFAKVPGLRDTVVAIRKATRQLDVTRAIRQLLKVFEDAALAAWVSKLPRGEGDALARLRALHPEWARRRAKGGTAVVTVTSDDLMRRAYTLAVEPMARVLRVGRYLTRGVADREGDYGRFMQPAPTTRAKKTVDGEKKPVVDVRKSPVDPPTG